jgi:hypothetical protein
MRVFPTILALLACLLAPLLLHVERCAQAQGEAQVIRLPNNSSITLLGWSYGTYHELTPGREARHIGIIPPDRPDPNEIASCETEEEALVFWIKRAGPAAHVDNLSMHLDWMRRQVRVADENGHEIAPTLAHWRMNRTTSPHALTDDPIAIASFPRRGRAVILRVYSPDASHVLGEFRIPNPVRNVPPPFVVGKFPVTQRSGDLEVTLSQVVKGRARHFLQNGGRSEIYGDMLQTPAGYRAAPEESRRMESHAAFTFRGKPSAHWALNAMNAAMQDASGNVLAPDLLGAGNDTLCYLAPNIGEPVRLRISAVQKADREFIPDRLWSVSGVSIPAPGAVARTNSAARMENVDIRLLGVAGAGVRQLNQSYFSPAPPGFVAVLLHLSYAGPPPDYVLRVVDARGRPILPSDPFVPPHYPGSGPSRSPWFGHGGSIGPTYGDYIYLVKVPPGSGKMNLTFGLNRARFFDFVLPVSVP